MGRSTGAEVAALPSPTPPGHWLNNPVPATVTMELPLALTRRTRLLFVSAMNREPQKSNASAEGVLRSAAAAAPPSPPKPAVPVPANASMLPVLTSTRRTRWASAMYTLPPPSTATAEGVLRHAFVAGPPLPGGHARLPHTPANTVTLPLRLSTRRTTCASSSTTYSACAATSNATEIGFKKEAASRVVMLPPPHMTPAPVGPPP